MSRIVAFLLKIRENPTTPPPLRKVIKIMEAVGIERITVIKQLST